MVSSAPVRSPESESSASSLHAIFEKALNDDVRSPSFPLSTLLPYLPLTRLTLDITVRLQYPPPLAAILSLTETLSSHPTSTTSHLLLSLHHNSALLLSSPLATYGAQAGTRLFERWVRDAVGGAGRAVKIDDVKANIVEEGRRLASSFAGNWLCGTGRGSRADLIGMIWSCWCVGSPNTELRSAGRRSRTKFRAS
jgi:hypothetical protein